MTDISQEHCSTLTPTNPIDLNRETTLSPNDLGVLIPDPIDFSLGNNGKTFYDPFPDAMELRLKPEMKNKETQVNTNLATF